MIKLGIFVLLAGITACSAPRLAAETQTSADGSAPMVALTFDDGPHPSLTPKLLDILEGEGVAATFFVIGSLVEANSQIIKRMADGGHQIGNHTWDHKDMRKLSETRVVYTLQRTSEAVEKACGRPTLGTRPPYGGMNSKTEHHIPSEYKPVIMWDVDPLDWKKPGSGVVAQRIISGAKPGAIILAHDIHSGTIDAIPQVIRELKAKGYQFVTVEEILSSKNSVLR